MYLQEKDKQFQDNHSFRSPRGGDRELVLLSIIVDYVGISYWSTVTRNFSPEV